MGNHNFLMALSHMAHNSSLGNHVVVVNGALVGGYVEVADRAFISANCLLHQFIRVGTLVMMRGGSRASRDLPPYANIDDTHTVKGVNLVGLRRAGLAAAQIAPLRQAFRLLLRPAANLKQALEQVEDEVTLTPEVDHLLEFIRASKRGVAMGPRQARRATMTSKRLLVIKLKQPGDVLVSTPVIAALKEAWPNCHLTYLVPKGTEDMVAGHPGLDDLMVVDRRGADLEPGAAVRPGPAPAALRPGARTFRRRPGRHLFLAHRGAGAPGFCARPGCPSGNAAPALPASCPGRR